MRGFLAAVGFLTRVPVPASVWNDAGARARALAWYPLVGLLVGLALTALALALHATPRLLAAALVLAAWVGVTGGLHLDGLADSADAWVGGMGDRGRTLDIMKDARSGPAGVTAIVLVLVVKFAALASLAPAAWPALVLAPLLGRAALTLAFLTTPYVRPGGIGRALALSPRVPGTLALLLASAVAFAVEPWRGLACWVAAGALFLLWRRACLRRLGGMTGDTCGALAELTEAATLAAWLIAA